jgi:hypothetical protein
MISLLLYLSNLPPFIFMKTLINPIELEERRNIYDSFDYFLKIFWKSFDSYTKAKHLTKWANQLQFNNNCAILSARKHLKSTIIYAYLMWLIYTRRNKNIEVLYLSFKEDLARYHIGNIKKFIQSNSMFDCRDLTTAQSEINYTWMKDEYLSKFKSIKIHPAGILSFKRGYHPDIVICDDILADPSQELNLTIIDKINRIFFEDVMSLPKEGGEIKLVGTAQHTEDLFFKLKDKKNWAWSSNPAIINETNKEVLWPEMFSYDRLIEIRDQEVGEKAFNKEYLCTPVWSEDAFFKREEILRIIDNGLKNVDGVPDNFEVIAGLDIGKVRHPSHLSIFLLSQGLYIQIYQIFMDNWDYTKQVNLINQLIKDLKIRKIYYDDTRSEFESFAEQGIIQRGIWTGVKLTQSEKFKIATNFGKIVSNGIIRLQNNQRMIRSLLSVNNNLDALETSEGHGDAFWSIALALKYRKSESPFILGIPNKRV